jgi:hypothetical protein
VCALGLRKRRIRKEYGGVAGTKLGLPIGLQNSPYAMKYPFRNKNFSIKCVLRFILNQPDHGHLRACARMSRRQSSPLGGQHPQRVELSSRLTSTRHRLRGFPKRWPGSGGQNFGVFVASQSRQTYGNSQASAPTILTIQDDHWPRGFSADAVRD